MSICPQVWEETMSRKQASKRKSRACAVPLLSAAGLSLSAASGAAAAPVEPAVGHEIVLGEEEISDVSLATFYVFDKENPRPDLLRVGGGHGHGHGCGCGGCGGHWHGHGCGGHWHGCRGCGGWGWRGCVGIGIGCGGCGGCSGGYWCWRNGVRVWCYY